MRTLLFVAALAGTAYAGPVVRFGTTGGTDTSAPGGKDDGVDFGAGFRSGAFTATLDYAYLDYDGTSGIGGGSHRLGVLVQAEFAHSHCRAGETYCPHFDLEAGVGRRWLHWENDPSSTNAAINNTIDRQGGDYRIGVSANFGLRFAIDYFVFRPQSGGPEVSCRSTTGGCPMNTVGDDHGVLLEVSFAVGG